MASYTQILRAQQDLQTAQEDYVRQYGWKETCNIPGSYWMWSRDFLEEDMDRMRKWHAAGAGPMGWPSKPQPYGRITADLKTAINMTRSVLDPREDEMEDEEVT